MDGDGGVDGARVRGDAPNPALYQPPLLLVPGLPVERSMTLPESVDESAINAPFQDGVLEVRITGAAAVREPRRIQIEGAGGEASENGNSEN